MGTKIAHMIADNEIKKYLQAALVDLENLKSAYDTLVTKLNTDFTAQNLAVTSSQLDEDYVASVALTLEDK